MLSDDFGTLDAEYKCELRGQQHGALSPQRAAVSLVLMFYHLLCANTVKSNKNKGFSILADSGKLWFSYNQHLEQTNSGYLGRHRNC